MSVTFLRRLTDGLPEPLLLAAALPIVALAHTAEPPASGVVLLQRHVQPGRRRKHQQPEVG